MKFVAHPMVPSKILKSQEKKINFFTIFFFNKIVIFPRITIFLKTYVAIPNWRDLGCPGIC